MKRSTQVALLVMGAAGMAIGANALTAPRAACPPPTIGAPAKTGVPAAQPCTPRSSSSSGSRWYYSSYWGRSWFWRGTTPASANAGSVALAGKSSGSSAPNSATIGTARGGFGSTGHAMASSSS